MSRQGKAKVLKPSEFKHVLDVAENKPHAKRNIALLYASFGLGLRAKEMASLRIQDVVGPDGQLLEELNLKRQNLTIWNIFMVVIERHNSILTFDEYFIEIWYLVYVNKFIKYL